MCHCQLESRETENEHCLREKVPERFARDIQILAGYLAFDCADSAERALLEAVNRLPESLSPTVHWTVRSLAVVAVYKIAALAAHPDIGARMFRGVFLAPSTHAFAIAIRDAFAELRRLKQPPSVLTSRTAAVLDFVESNLHDPKLNLSFVSESFRLSRWHLSRLLLRDTGLTYREMVRRMRVNRAAHMLRSPQLSIKEISAALGYGYPTQLDRDFKREFGIAPSLWRTTAVVQSHRPIDRPE